MRRPYSICLSPCQSAYTCANLCSSAGAHGIFLDTFKISLQAPVVKQRFAGMYANSQGIWQMLYGLFMAYLQIQAVALTPSLGEARALI